MTTANLLLAKAETVTLFSTSDGLVPVSSEDQSVGRDRRSKTERKVT
jgi:hypothetical protein